ncbi:MAG: hypothetical protein GY909_15395 [Oligoflexia bacterium]|nr:hypothetical protein [Oligoflexia bacterium]
MMMLALENYVASKHGFIGKYTINLEDTKLYLSKIDLFKESKENTFARVKEILIPVKGYLLDERESSRKYNTDKKKVIDKARERLDLVLSNTKEIILSNFQTHELSSNRYLKNLDLEITSILNSLNDTTVDELILFENVYKNIFKYIEKLYQEPIEILERLQQAISNLNNETFEIEFYIHNDLVNTQVISRNGVKMNSLENHFSIIMDDLNIGLRGIKRSYTKNITLLEESIRKWRVSFPEIIEKFYDEFSMTSLVGKLSDFDFLKSEATRVSPHVYELFKHTSYGKYIENSLLPILRKTKIQADKKIRLINSIIPLNLTKLSDISTLPIRTLLEADNNNIYNIALDENVPLTSNMKYIPISFVKEKYPEIAKKLNLFAEIKIGQKIHGAKHLKNNHCYVKKIETNKYSLRKLDYQIIGINLVEAQNFNMSDLEASFKNIKLESKMLTTIYINPELPEIEEEKIVAIDIEIINILANKR